jgi:hypothetical protein
MKKISQIAIVSFFILSKTIFAQEFNCSTPTPINDNTSNNFTPQTILTNARIQVKIHIIRRTDGGGSGVASISDCITAFNIAHASFLPHNICLLLVGIDYLDNSDIYTLEYENPVNDLQTVTNFLSTPNAIDIYIAPDRNFNNNLGGVAISIPGKSLAIHGSLLLQNNGTTLIHETGHCLGLYHTFETLYCSELTDGSNCTTCGDMICDTPADPTLLPGDVENCLYISGQGYNPDVTNFMTYGDYECRNHFTTDQGLRMLEKISMNIELINCLAPSNIALSSINLPLLFLFNPIYSLSYYAENTISINNSTLSVQGDLNLLAGETIEITSEFYVHQGAEFSAQLGQVCPPDNILRVISANSTDDYYSIDHDTIGEYYNRKNNRITDVIIYPNPSTGIFTLQKPTDTKAIIVAIMCG